MLDNQIVKTWRGNHHNTILCAIPVAMTRQYGLDKPTYVILEPKDNGILLRKLEGSEVQK
jgi:hypothetical protein